MVEVVVAREAVRLGFLATIIILTVGFSTVNRRTPRSQRIKGLLASKLRRQADRLLPAIETPSPIMPPSDDDDELNRLLGNPNERPNGSDDPNFDTDRNLFDTFESEEMHVVEEPSIDPIGHLRTLIRPSQIRDQLTSVIGQSTAKDFLSVLFTLHFHRIGAAEPVSTGLPSAVLVGPTGVGKTHTMRTLAALYKLPFVTVDSTTLVEAGIVGEHPEDIAQKLVDQAAKIVREHNGRNDRSAALKLAEFGIVFFDEFDKIAFNSESSGESSQQRGLLTQRTLLKFIEGNLVRVGLDHGGFSRHEDFLNTANMLIIAGGAFARIDSNEIRAKRRLPQLQRGSESVVTTEDIQNYGFMPELVGRLPIIIPFDPLSEEDLTEIIETPVVSPLTIWKSLFAAMGIEFLVQDSVAAAMSSRASRLGMGARGLQQVIFPLLAAKTIEADAGSFERLELEDKDFKRTSRLSALAALDDQEV